MKAAVFFFVITLLPFQALSANDATQARKICAIFDGTGLLSGKCEISAMSGKIKVSADMSSNEARSFCRQISPVLRERNLVFSDRTWTLEIFSPYSGSNTIAVCDLPRR